ncbi:MAG: glycosyltransferase family 2 protein [Synechococcales cyanobacterium CRU_2_2]|nr:glycosyltransferase family 2 protein [Synechococcales cyanobacterium CRU_2_2]
MKLSIVATLYRSESYIHEFCYRSAEAAKLLVVEDYEIVLVNDGSPDQSLAVAVALSQEEPYLKVIDLSRNFGHHKAMMTGLAYANGDYIFLIDSDLEEAPEWLLDFYPQLKSENCDVVYGVQRQRKGNLFERLTGQWFYMLFQALTGLALPRNVVTARLMTHRYVEALLSHREREVFMAGLWHITGFVQQPYRVTKQSTSETTYTVRRKMSLLINSVTSFSNMPLIGIFYIGLTIFLVASLFTLYLVVNRLFFAKPLSGWTSVMASIWLLGGLVISFIGVIGIYLSKIFSETKQRPYTIVRRIYGKSHD